MTRDAPRASHEGGFSLIETVVSLAILLMIIPALLGALFTAVDSARAQHGRAIDNELMLSVAEAVKADPYDATCPNNYPTVGVAIPPTSTLTMPCVAVSGQPAAYPLQIVTITVRTGSGSTAASTSVVVVKSNRS